MNFHFYNTPWINQNTQNWDFIPFKLLFGFQKVKSLTSNPEVLSLTQQGVVVRDITTNEGQIAADYSDSSFVSVGDFVLNPMDLRSGSVAISAYDGVTSNAYYIFRIRAEQESSVNPRFYEYFLWANYRNDVFYSHGSGIGRPEGGGGGRWTLGRDILQGFPMPLPPIEEQRRIVNFLDGQIKRIDGLITLMRNEINRLDEWERGYVFDCLFKQASFDSKRGFQLIGADENWPVAPLYHLCDEVRSKNSGSIETNLLSLSYGNVIDKDIESREGLLPESFENYNRVKPGDIVLRLTDLQNDQKSLRVGRVNKKGIITSAYTTLRPKDVIASFLTYQLKAFDSAKFFYALGGGLRQSMKFDDLKNLPILLPSESEQEYLVHKIDSAFSTSNSLRKKLREQIQLLNELRVSTVTAAVTGALDVPTERSVA